MSFVGSHHYRQKTSTLLHRHRLLEASNLLNLIHEIATVDVFHNKIKSVLKIEISSNQDYHMKKSIVKKKTYCR